MNGIFLPFLCLIPLFVIITLLRTAKVIVIDSKTKERLNYVNIKFYDDKTFQVAYAILTNKNGVARFNRKYLNYYISLHEKGYKFPSKLTDEKIIQRIGKDHYHKIKYKDNKGDLIIFMDRVD